MDMYTLCDYNTNKVGYASHQREHQRAKHRLHDYDQIND